MSSTMWVDSHSRQSQPRLTNEQPGDIAWVTTATALVLLMIPGVG